jgi:hypothetical protein
MVDNILPPILLSLLGISDDSFVRRAKMSLGDENRLRDIEKRFVALAAALFQGFNRTHSDDLVQNGSIDPKEDYQIIHIPRPS